MKTKRFLLSFFIFSLLLVCFNFCSTSYAAYKSSYAEPSILIRTGCYGSGVRWVQDMLNHNGYNLDVDGVFGNGTLTAVKSFQRKYNLTVDGIVGKSTRTALKTYAISNSANLNTGISNTTNNSSSTNNTSSSNTIMYTTANLNLRKGASTSYSIILTIPKSSSVSVISKSNEWAYAKYNSTYGYVSTNYLSSTKPIINNTTSTTSGSLPTFSRGATNLMNIIKNCKAYYAANNFYYSTAPSVRSIPADKSVITDSYKRYYTDCSNYVSWVLYEYALANGNTNMKNYFSYQRNSTTFKNIGDNGGNSYLSVVSKKTSTSNVNLANVRPGDILVSPGHVEFFNSYTLNTNGTVNLKVYNCGSTATIQASGITTSATRNISDITYILRVK